MEWNGYFYKEIGVSTKRATKENEIQSVSSYSVIFDWLEFVVNFDQIRFMLGEAMYYNQALEQTF